MKYNLLRNRDIHTLRTYKLAFAGLFVVHKNTTYIHLSFPIYLLTFDSWSFQIDASASLQNAKKTTHFLPKRLKTSGLSTQSSIKLDVSK